MARKNPLFGFLTSRKEPFKQRARGKITYHKDVAAERRELLEEIKEARKEKAKERKKASAERLKPKNKRDREMDREISRLIFGNPGVRGTVKLVGKGRRTRLVIYT